MSQARIDASSAEPARLRVLPTRLKYLELAHRLLDDITREGLVPGDRIGTEEEIGEKHNASRFTVRHALSMLAREGYISRKKALGTFVKTIPEQVNRASIVRGTVMVACSNEQASHMNEDFAFSTVLRSIERTLADKGYVVQIIGLGQDQRTDVARLGHLVTRDDLNGMIAIGNCLDPYRDMLGGLPTVFTGYFYSSVAPIVGDDVLNVCRECVGHLISRGHREIAVICGPGVDANGFGLFVRGCKDSFEAASLAFHRRSVYHAYPGESLVELAKQVLSTDPRPTGVFAENWRVAEAVIQAAACLGLEVPGDISLIGYGQNVMHISAPVPITAHVPDSEGIGRRAAELLVEMLEGAPAPATPVMLGGNLIQRQSVRTLASESSL